MTKKVFGEGAFEHLLETLKNKFNLKQDKVTGKGLSTNDYTNTEKNKLTGIEKGADKSKVTSVNGQVGDVVIESESVDIVDNLVTDDSTKALSAKQGKVLDGKVGVLTGTKADKEKIIISAYNPPIDLSLGSFFLYAFNGTVTLSITNTPSEENQITRFSLYFDAGPAGAIINLPSNCTLSKGIDMDFNGRSGYMLDFLTFNAGDSWRIINKVQFY